MDQNIIKHEKEEEKQNLVSYNIKKEYDRSDSYGEDQDPLSTPDPIPISFETLKKEEKDIKREKNLKEEDLSQDEEHTADPQHTSGDNECGDNEITFTKLLQNCILKSNSQNVEKEISKPGNRNSSVLSTFQQKQGKDFGESSENTKKLNFQNYFKKHNCEYCDKKYSGVRDLKDHINSNHLGIRGYKCEKCGKMYFWSSELKKHNCSVPKMYDKYQNQGCKKEFLQPSNLEQRGVVLRERKFVCHDCNRRFLEIFTLKNHIEVVHLEMCKYKYTKYNISFSQSSEIKRRNNPIQENIKKYECQVCRRLFSKFGNLKQHSVVHIDKKFVCDDCGEKYFGFSELKSHIIQVHFNEESKISNEELNFEKKYKKYACGNCDVRYFSVSAVETHIRGAHLGIGSYKCVQCNEMFPQACELKIHVWNVHENLKCKIHCNAYIFECQVCNMEFSNPGNLKQHSVVHSEKKYVCKCCNMRFVEVSNLKNHMREVHCTQRSEPISVKMNMNIHSNNEKYANNEKCNIHSNDNIYACADCDQRYSWIRDLRKHIGKVHSGHGNFKCARCSKVYSCPSKLIKHTCSEIHECQFCNKEFSNVGNLNQHSIEHKQNKNVCNDYSNVEFSDLKNNIKGVHCGRENVTTSEELNIYSKNTHSGEKFKFSDIENWIKQVHYEESSKRKSKQFTVYEKNEMYVCGDCNQKCFTLKALQYHIEAVHLGIKPYKCEKCNKGYSSSSALSHHIKEVHNNTLQRARGYKCDQCCKTFSQVSDLKSHITSTEHKCRNIKVEKTTNTELNFHKTCKMYACSNCDRKYSDVGELKNHISLEHFGSNCYKCGKCNVTFSQSFHLTRHINSKHKYKDYIFEKIDKKYICALCDQRYSQLKYLKYHIEGIHLGIGDYKCEQCNKTYSSLHALKNHANSEAHKNYRKFKCDICNKKFSQLCNLKRHFGLHNNKRKLVCEYCGKKMFTNSNLKLHINAVHNKVRNFECEVCKKTFQFLHHLRSHIICVHEKLKNFVCDQCGDRFLLAHHLRNHINHIHRGIERNSRTINYYNKLIGV